MRTILCCILTVPAIAQVQASDKALNDFRAEILGHRLVLQGFSADDTTKFRWTGSGLSLTPPKLHTLGVLSPESVELRKGQLRISGRRHILFKARDGSMSLAGDVATVIVVDLEGDDLVTVLPKLKSQLFFATIEAAIAAIPAEYSLLLPARAEHVKVVSPTKDQLAKAMYGCPVPGAKYAPPAPVRVEDPKMTLEERLAPTSATSRIVFTVDERGHAVDLWLAIPHDIRGSEYDESAAKAISLSMFNPATCDGVPVKTALTWDFKF